MWIHREDWPQGKMCFCIGPEKCRDASCHLVREHRRRNKKVFEDFKKNKKSLFK